MSDEKIEDAPNIFNEVVADALGSTIHGQPVAIDDKALIAKYGFYDIEATFTMRDPVTNELLREKEPCYECGADCYLGRGRDATFWPEGSIVVYTDTPNVHMKPLNRAAAINYARWMESLPMNRVPFDIGDMSEAAVILSKDPRVKEMTVPQAQRAAIAVAEGLKLKREGKSAMDLRVGDINRNFAPQSGAKAPPVLGAKTSDMSQMGPGMTRNQAVLTGPSGGARRAGPAAAAPMTGVPAGR